MANIPIEKNMSSSIRIRVPKVLIENVPDRSETIREALNDALKMELKPIYSQALLSIYTSVYLGGPLASDIAMAHQEEKSLGRTAQGLLAAYVLHGQSCNKLTLASYQGFWAPNSIFCRALQ